MPIYTTRRYDYSELSRVYVYLAVKLFGRKTISFTYAQMYIRMRIYIYINVSVRVLSVSFRPRRIRNDFSVKRDIIMNARRLQDI